MTIYEWAKAYRKLGWNVVPLYNYSKSPALIKTQAEDGTWQTSWLPLEHRMATDVEFDTWFQDDKVTGIGVITGKVSGIVVVDEDSYKADGMKFDLISPLRSKTGRGGKHHFFRYTEPIKTSGFRKGVNIEIKSDGGFIVLPPSQVFTTAGLSDKGVYEWISKPKKLDEVPTISETQLLLYRGSALDDGKPVDVLELRNVEYGNQHNSLRTMALAILNRFPEREWAMAEDIIRKEAAQYDPPHPLPRVEKMIRDCEQFVKNNPKDTVEKMVQALEPRSINSLVADRIAEKELEKNCPSTGWPELDYLIKGFIPTHLYTLTGNENVGKTTIACNFAERLRQQGRKVLYIALEPGTKVLDYLASVRYKKKFDEVTDEDYGTLDDGNIRVFVDRDIESATQLAETVRNLEEKYDLIIIDHIGYFVRDKDNFIQEQSNVVKELAFLAKEKRTAILMIAHLRKKSSAQKADYVPTNDDISGSGAFKQDSTEVMIVIRKKAEGDEDGLRYSAEGKLFVTKTKCGPNGSVPLVFSERKAYIASEGEQYGMSYKKDSPDAETETIYEKQEGMPF